MTLTASPGLKQTICWSIGLLMSTSRARARPERGNQ